MAIGRVNMVQEELLRQQGELLSFTRNYYCNRTNCYGPRGITMATVRSTMVEKDLTSRRGGGGCALRPRSR